jgi:hypothetical protein
MTPVSRDLTVAVNLSMLQAPARRTDDRLKQVLADHGLRADRSNWS